MNATVDDAPRESIDHYTLLQVLGRGSMGTVYLARNERDAKLVALKRFNEDLRGSQEARDRFLREVDVLRDLRGHEHIVLILDRSWTGESMYLVMEYCNGGSVDALVKKRGGNVPLREALSLTYQILDGLEYAHTLDVRSASTVRGFVLTRGIVHRDIKPSNILLHKESAGSTVKIGDFGLAKMFALAGLTAITKSATIGGTLNYAPRHQLIDFKRSPPAVDVWGTAATLYFMLTGFPPREILPSMTQTEAEKAIYDMPAVPIRSRIMNIPGAVADVIDAGLNDREKELPFASAAQFKNALMCAAIA